MVVAFPFADTWGMHGDIGTGWWIVMMGAMVLFWGAIILGAVWLLRGSSEGWRDGRRRETPVEVLEHKLAEGTMSIEEYRQRRELLAEGPSGVQQAPVEAGRPAGTGPTQKGIES